MLFTMASMQIVKNITRKEGKNEIYLLTYYDHELYTQFKDSH